MTARAIVEQFVNQVWNQRQLEQVYQLFSPDFVATPVAYQSMWNGTGPESMKHHVQEWLEGVPDLQMQTIEIIEQDNKVAWQWKMTGTHKGILYGVPPTEQVITALGITFFVIEANQICQLHTAFDALGLMQQLGVLPDAGTIIQRHLQG
ncbi:MAG: hypothetical protein Kow00121_68740 [Elainellaceae cyanobacterium]